MDRDTLSLELTRLHFQQNPLEFDIDDKQSVIEASEKFKSAHDKIYKILQKKTKAKVLKREDFGL